VPKTFQTDAACRAAKPHLPRDWHGLTDMELGEGGIDLLVEQGHLQL
jgi:hypothetical protein